MNLNKISDINREYKSSLIDFFEVSRDAFFIFDKNLRIIYINPQIERFLKIKNEETVGKTLLDVFPSSKDFLALKKYHKAMYDGVPQFFEVFSESMDTWVEVNVYPLKNRIFLVNIRDITEKKREELELKENEYLFRTSFEKIDQAFMIIELLYDETGNINNYKFIKVNDMLEKYTGFKNDDLVGKTVKQTSLKIEFSWLMNYDEVNKTGRSKHFINFNKVTERWHDVFCFPYDNNKIGVFFRDITEKAQVEEALYKSEGMYEAFMTACFDSVFKASSDWAQVNILKGTGILADTQGSGSNWMEKYIHPKNRSYFASEINKAILNKSIFDLEYRILKKNGSSGWMHVRAVPIINKDGDIVEWFGAVSDITLKKEFELKLIEKEKEYLEIIDSSSLGTFIIDFEKKECHISETWKGRLGFENLNNKEIFLKFVRTLHLEDIDRFVTFKTNSINEKRPKYSVEYRVKTVDSGYIWILAQSKILYNKEGEPVKAYGTHIDITDRKLAENALRKSEEEAQKLVKRLREVDEHKSNFISALSHEFRNPLATITMVLSLAESTTPGSEQDVHMREIVKRQTTQLIRLVDDLLDVTKIERNKIELIRENVEIKEIVKKVLEDLRVQFDAEGVVLKEEYYAEPMYINADSIRIGQVMGNLLSNSLKFTGKDGTVKLAVSKDDSNKNVVIKVSDTGIGIDPEFLPYLFESFVQADSSPARSAGGLGLGLSIVKGIVDLHGGLIIAESEGLGKGSEFTIKLPLL